MADCQCEDHGRASTGHELQERDHDNRALGPPLTICGAHWTSSVSLGKLDRTVRSRSGLLALTLLVLASASCTSDLQRRADSHDVRGEEPPILVSRTGVPILMDIPVIGFLFGRTVVVGGARSSGASASGR